MRKLQIGTLFILPMSLLLSLALQAQISLTGQPYNQDFNTLATTGTSSVMPSGWLFTESGSNANALYTAGTGSGNSGDTYSFGASASSERSLGGLQSSSLAPVFGAYFVNNTGGVITSIKISYKGEQWRLGATGRNDALDFQYSLDATSLATGTWVDVNQLDFTAPVTAGTVGPLDGNAAANQVSVAHTLTGLTIAAGASIYIRWNDLNATGSDDGLSVDDFSLETISGGDNVSPQLSSLTPLNRASFVELNPVMKMTFNEPVAKGTGNIIVKRKSDATVVATIDITNVAVLVSSNTVSFNLSGLAFSTLYYVELDASAIKDLAGNSFTGFTGDATWSFTTKGASEFRYEFNDCSAQPYSGWLAYSLKGDSAWTCSIFGNGGTNGLQINGFVSGTGAVDNDDWLVSPALDLSTFSFVSMTMDMRTKFAGPQPQIYVAMNQPTMPLPGSSTWVPLNAFLPKPNSDAWTTLSNIDLSAYKSSSTFIAIRYTSSPSSGAARVTLDNIFINSVNTRPAAAIRFEQPRILHFEGTQVGVASASQSFSFQILNPQSDLTINASSGFSLSSDNNNFGSSLVFTPDQQKGGIKTCFVRYTPAAVATSTQGQMIFSSTGLANTPPVVLMANSFSRTATFDVVNWNIEWFGSAAAGQGPTNDDLAQANIKRVMDSLDADLYAFAEVVDVNRFKSLIESLSGYGYVVADYASNAPDASGAAYASGQKLAFAYRKSVINNIEVRGLMRTSSTASSNWASGRLPYLLKADVVNGSAVRKMNFILVHGKSGNTATDHKRRFDGAKELKDTLDAHFNAAHLMILGDFNDDLDSTISTGINPALTSYDPIVKDSTDSDRYKSLSLLLSNTGSYSVLGYEDVVDHLVISNELEDLYIPGSVRLVRSVESWIADYANTTSDHYPLLSRFLMPSGGVTAIANYDPMEIRLSIKGNPAVRQLYLECLPATGKLGLEVYTIRGEPVYKSRTFNVLAQPKNYSVDLSSAASGTYLLRVVNNGKQYIQKFILKN
jgi:hypothetical protein